MGIHYRSTRVLEYFMEDSSGKYRRSGSDRIESQQDGRDNFQVSQSNPINSPVIQNLIAGGLVFSNGLVISDLPGLRRHYIRLNRNVFIKLRDSKPNELLVEGYSWNTLEIFYSIKEIESSDYFGDAELHLAESLPDYLSKAKSIEEDCRTLTKQVDAYKITVRDLIKKRLEGIATITDDATPKENEIYFPNAIGLIENCWFTKILYRCTTDNQDLETSLSKVNRIEVDFPPIEEKPGYLRLGAFGLAQGLTPTQKQSLLQALFDIETNREILIEMLRFHGVKQGLVERGRVLSDGMRNLVHLIEDERYNTVVDCCLSFTMPQEDFFRLANRR